MSPDDLITRLKHRKTGKPDIVIDPQGSYVIIGSIRGGQEIPTEGIEELTAALKGVVALKTHGSEENFKLLNALSTEIIVRTTAKLDSIPYSYFPHSFGEEDIGDRLLKYGAPKEIAEIYVPFNHMRVIVDVPNGFFDRSNLAIMFEDYSSKFSFIDIGRAIENTGKVVGYLYENELEPFDLDHFALDFELFMVSIREYDLWRHDLIEFRAQYDGKVAVCCHAHNVPFVQLVLEGREPPTPNWDTHIDSMRKYPRTPQDPNQLKEIYRHLEKALGLEPTIK